jgi:integrase
MAGKPTGLEGIHFVSRALAGGRTRWHVYAWRGGPRIMTADQVLKPALTPEAVAAYNEAHTDKAKPLKDTFASLAEAYVRSPEYRSLAASTRKNWHVWIERAKERFGAARLRMFSDTRMRGDILEWRDKWAHAPRQADYGMEVLSRILSWGVQRGWVLHNPALGAPTLYRSDRSEIIWEDFEIEAVVAKMKPAAARAFRLAAWTGLSRGDLLSLRWSDVGDLYIGGKRGKTKVERVIPLFDETRAIIAECPKTATTVLTSRAGKPYKTRGFAASVERARTKAKVAAGKTLHDLRGSFATKLMQRGFEDREIDEALGWETGKSSRIRRKYIARKAIVISAIERMRRRTE